MNNRSPLPKVGDRVRINDSGPIFVVVEVNSETQSASLIVEEVVASVPLSELAPADGQRKRARP